MKFPRKTILPLLLVALPAFSAVLAGDAVLPEKLRGVLTKLDTFESEQIAAAEKAIEKKRAEVATFLRTEMEKYARDGKVDTAVAIRQAILELESGAPLDKIRNAGGGAVTSAGGRAQTIFREKDFEDYGKNWSGNAFYKPAAKRGVLELTVSGAGPKYEAIGVSIPLTNFSERPILRVRARAEKAAVLRIDLQDARGNGTSTLPVHERIQKTDEFRDYHFDFSRHAGQPEGADLTRIQTLIIYVNPGANAFDGVIYFDELESSDRRD